jgi:hypothetical protein
MNADSLFLPQPQAAFINKHAEAPPVARLGYTFAEACNHPRITGFLGTIASCGSGPALEVGLDRLQLHFTLGTYFTLISRR